MKKNITAIALATLILSTQAQAMLRQSLPFIQPFRKSILNILYMINKFDDGKSTLQETMHNIKNEIAESPRLTDLEPVKVISVVERFATNINIQEVVEKHKELIVKEFEKENSDI